MTVEELEGKYKAAQLRVEKAKNTLNKYYAKRDKLANKLNSINKDINITPDNYTELANKYKDEDFNYYQNHLQLCFWDYEWNEDSIKDSIRKIKDLEEIANNWKIKIEKESSKQDKLTDIKQTVPSEILDFIHEWRVKCEEWYEVKLEKYKEARIKLSELYNNYSDLRYKDKEKSENYYNEYKELMQKIKELYDDAFLIKLYHEGSHYKELLTKTLDKEEEFKILDLIRRITPITGQITKGSYLSIGNQNGELNGIIEGDKGKAKIETISAGGYNIQRFHYRVLVKELK